MNVVNAMQSIEVLTREYADAYQTLAAAVETLEAAIRDLKKKKLPAIKRAAEKAAVAKETLKTAIESVPQLFEKPRTRLLHGVKVGMQKAKGELEIPNGEKTVELIRKHFADLADTLIRVEETPVKKALANLPAVDLKRIGVTVIETGDQVVIKIAGTDVERLVDALLDSDEEAAHEKI